MAHQILKKFSTQAKLLDDMLFKLETNLGKQHTVSPFSTLYQKYGYSSSNVHGEQVAKEETKEEIKVVE